MADHAPLPEPGKRLILGGDASSILRPPSKTAQDRTYVHVSNLPDGCKPVCPGWQFSELAVLPPEPSSWVYVLDPRRIPRTATQGEVMAEQLREVVPRLPQRPRFLGDGYYGSEAFVGLCADIDGDVLGRFAKNRVLYREPLPPSGPRKRGPPLWHGPAFRLNDPSTHGAPDQSGEGRDAHGHPVEVACWHDRHFKRVRHQKVCVARGIRHGAAGTTRDPRQSWFLTWGQNPAAAEAVPGVYRRRYRLEHGYRFSKQDRFWEEPRLRTPEQFSLGTEIVSLVQHELFLAKDLAQAQRQPWERKSRQSTPEQGRRAMGRIISQWGTPARPCQPRGYSPGGPVGRARQPADTYTVIYKAAQESPPRSKKKARDGPKLPEPLRTTA